MMVVFDCFTMNTSNSSIVQNEIMGAINAIEIAFNNGWNNLWLECDSQLVVMAARDSLLFLRR